MTPSQKSQHATELALGSCEGFYKEWLPEGNYKVTITLQELPKNKKDKLGEISICEDCSIFQVSANEVHSFL